jgi:glyoxylase-like metal-dependent hydrolase (beta-lactamase superfamily II)
MPDSPPVLRAGNYEIRSIIAGWNRLDGGAMFGVVPKVMWAPGEDVDDQNRMLMALRVLLAVDRKNGRVILVDSGPGSKWPAKEAARFAVVHEADALPGALADFGCTEEDVTDVIQSHLHFDHTGGIARWADKPGGRTTYVYPNARHWVHQKQWEHALAPTDRDRASYLKRDLELFVDSDRLSLVRGDDPASEIPGVRWEISHGHTPYQLHPVFEDDESPVQFVGDMIPTASHLPPTWVMAYDLFPLTAMEERKRFYERSRADGTIAAFPHDRRFGAARLDLSGKRPAVAEKLFPTPS